MRLWILLAFLLAGCAPRYHCRGREVVRRTNCVYSGEGFMGAFIGGDGELRNICCQQPD